MKRRTQKQKEETVNAVSNLFFSFMAVATLILVVSVVFWNFNWSLLKVWIFGSLILFFSEDIKKIFRRVKTLSECINQSIKINSPIHLN